MEWKRFYFKSKKSGRSNKVWAPVDDTGELVVGEDGLVEMKYNKSDDARKYSVRPDNLTVCGAGGNKPKAAPAMPSSSCYDPARCGQPQVVRQRPAELEDLSPPEQYDIVVYTDGACSSPANSGSGPSGIGVVFWDGINYKEISQYIGHATNSIAELQAVLTALQHLRDYSKRIVLKTDSQYVQRALTDWINNWRSNNWVNSSGKPVANQELIKTIDKRLEKFDSLSLEWVPGHDGVTLNERADWLATSAVDRGRG